MSEFGRTFRENGNRGTDHGHGTVYWVLGGAVNGGVIAGAQQRVSRGTLFQDRDYPVLNDYRAVLGGLFRSLWGLSTSQCASIFPQSAPLDLATRVDRARRRVMLRVGLRGYAQRGHRERSSMRSLKWITLIGACWALGQHLGVAGDGGLTVTISNDSHHAISLVTVYDLNTDPAQKILASQLINGFATVAVSVSADASGHGSSVMVGRSRWIATCASADTATRPI